MTYCSSDRAIVLFSGGIDSTACLYWAMKNYKEIILLSFLYGSKEDQVIERTNKKNSTLSTIISSKVVPLAFFEEILKTSFSKLSKDSDTPPEFKKNSELDDQSITLETAKQVWVPARNLLFLSIAASLADSYVSSTDIIFGANLEEGTTFPDNTQEFIDRMNAALEHGCLQKVQIVGPFSKMTKEQIVTFLDNEHAQYEYSSSCYNFKGWTDEEEPIHCGSCESCMRRKRAFQKAKLKDRTVYFIKD